MALHIQHFVLLALAPVAYVALHHFSNTNGFWVLLDAAVNNKVSGRQFTSSKPIDDTCNFFLAFFYPLTTGDHPGSSLASFVFAGQWVAGWAVIMMESYRVGNRGKLISYISLFGLLYQTLGLGLVAPLYLLAHLLTSPTTTSPTPSNLAIDANDLSGIYTALFMGYICPTIFISLPDPSIVSYEFKTNFILLWQLFPLWTSLFTTFWSRFVRLTSSIPSSPAESLIRSRLIYTSVIALAAIAHVAGMTLSLAPLIAPGIFNPAYAKQLTGAYLSFPPWPLDSGVKASGIAEGALWFLQYDYMLTGWAMVVWGFSLRLAAVKGKERGGHGISLLLISTVFKMVVFGPIGAVAMLVWERDEEVERGREGEDSIEVEKVPYISH